jgi:hypothetical protein
METKTIYCGSGKTKTGKFGEFFSVSICLSDLPAEHITTANNGKKYINLNINKKQQPDQYGKDLSVQVDTWKPESKPAPIEAHTPKQTYQATVSNEGDTLPF